VVRIERLMESEGRLFLVMERLRGRDLRSVVKEREGLMLSEIEDVMRPLCSALHQVHEAGIIHRDVKATNVFLEGDDPWRVVLLDFGIAKVAGETSTTVGRLIPGTPGYMAPEQLLGRAVDPKTDVYALGVLTFYMLTGKLPFRHENPEMLSYLHLHARRPKPSSLRRDVPAVIDELVVCAMSRDPARRPASALAFFESLESAIARAQLLDTLS
jgi:serine/threonine-protein kinase